uniref:COG2801: Transposase and inactivated derivatives n=1 Tax=Photobacterium damselae subsp. damselae TaxID=85581 RepID=E4WLC1_PHODD|nr:COG2801: Transposase and inactivated derivatives [Photobacterium damselae subsp. damselae]
MSLSPDSRLTGKALSMAYESRGKPKGIMLHSDQGSHYTSRKYRQLLWRFQEINLTIQTCSYLISLYRLFHFNSSNCTVSILN